MPLRHTALALLIALIWGINTVVVKYGLLHMPAYILTALRFFMVAAILVPFLRIPRIRVGAVLMMSVLVAQHFALGNYGMSLGLDIPTFLVASHISVPVSCLIGWLWFGDTMGKWRIFGMALAFGGIIIVAGSPTVLPHLTPFLITTCSGIMWAISNVMIKRIEGVRALNILGWLSLFAAPQTLAMSFFMGEDPVQQTLTMSSGVALSIAYSSLFSSIVAYGGWYYLLRQHDLSRVVPYSLLVPVIGVLVGQLVYYEPLTPKMIIGGLLTLSGVALIVLRRPKWVKFAEGT